MTPDTTAVRRSRTAHIDDDRLLRRARRIVADARNGMIPDGRFGFAHRAAELEAIRVELVRRHGAGALLLAPGLGPMTDRFVLARAASGV